jgi:hypothetical protein
VDGNERDDELRRVPEGGVEEAADARACVLGRVLRRLADQPGERDESHRREDELERLVQVERVVQQDDERREPEGREEDPANHGRVPYPPRARRPIASPGTAPLPETAANVKSCEHRSAW